MLPTLETNRLTLRHLSPTDWQNVLALDSDPEVMMYITANGRVLTEDESHTHFSKVLAYNSDNLGLGVWVAELKTTGEFIGLFGLKNLPSRTEVEIGFRLKKSAWGRGYANAGTFFF